MGDVLPPTFAPIGAAASRIVEGTLPVQRISVTDRATWLALRTKDLTASDLGAVAGLDHRRTALRVYAEKAGIITQPDDTDIMRRGRWLEAAVVEALRDQHPDWAIRRAGVYLRDPINRLGATPDVVAIDPARDGIGNIQCKVVSRPIFEAQWPDDRPPLGYELQTLAEAMLMEAAWAMVAALVVDTYTAELVEFEVARHAGAEIRIRKMARDFMAGVDERREPAPVYASDAEVIAAMFPTSEPGKMRDLAGDNHLPELLAELVDLKARIKADTGRREAIETELKSKIGEAEGATLPGWSMTWKPQSRAEHVVPASTFRVLRIRDRRPKEATR